MLRECRMDLLRGADGHGALVHDHLAVGDDLSRSAATPSTYCRSALPSSPGGGQGQEDHLGLVDGLLQLAVKCTALPMFRPKSIKVLAMIGT